MKRLVLTLAVLLLPLSVFAGELIFGWNKINEAGGIQDMKFMPDESQFLVLAGLGDNGVLQIRNSENGEQTNSFPVSIGSFAKFDFTPDSSRIILTNSKSGQLALYNLADMSLLKFFLLKDTIALWFTNIAIDPVSPYVYVTMYGEKTQPYYLKRGQVSVYNYETMELVKHLTPFDDTEYSCLAVSKDGKYLAAINTGISYLKVWDLNTMQLIRNFQLYDSELQNDYWCEPKDIKFSEKNTENIFYSGNFPSMTVIPNDGLFIYGIQENQVIDSSLNKIYASQFTLFDKEVRVVVSDMGMFFNIYNLTNKTNEFKTSQNLDSIIIQRNIIVSNNNIIIGSSGSKYSMVKYDSESGLPNIPNVKNTIYPNPTNNSVNIKSNCEQSIINYSIISFDGRILKESKIQNINNSIQIDFSKYPAGIYFLNLTCGKDISTYKIIKEK